MDPAGGRWGHWAPQILIASILATVLLGATPASAGGPFLVLSPVLLVGVVIATWVKMRRHDRGLCEHCVKSMPLNPSESAQRYRRRLTTAHLGARKGIVVGYLLVLLSADLLLVLAPQPLLQAAFVLWAAIQSSLIYVVLSHVTHRRLQPWCTECGGGGGRDDVDSRNPVPSDSGAR